MCQCPESEKQGGTFERGMFPVGVMVTDACRGTHAVATGVTGVRGVNGRGPGLQGFDGLNILLLMTA